MEPKFKIGDKVIIKDLSCYDDDYGVGVNDYMIEKSGSVMTISAVDSDWYDFDTYRLLEDDGRWCWAQDMIELYIENKPCKFMKRSGE